MYTQPATTNDGLPLYSSTGSFNADLEHLRRRANRQNDQTSISSAGVNNRPSNSLEIRNRDLPDYATIPNTENETRLAISDFIVDDEDDEEAMQRMETEIQQAMFNAITNGQSEIIAALINSNLSGPNAVDEHGQTALCAAVKTDNVRIVQELVDFGADIDGWSVVNGSERNNYRTRKYYIEIQRTPLMIAAERGNLTMVRLFLDVFHADDSLIAPDGQLALRLAASNGHREIVNILPSRRGGGMKRWKHKNRKSIRRMKTAGYKIYYVNKVVFFYIPKFFVWDIPKECLLQVILPKIKYLHKHRHELLGWIKDGAINAAKGTARFIKELPQRTWDFLKSFTEWLVKSAKDLAGLTKWIVVELSKWLWSLVTVRIPKLSVQTYHFVVNGIKTIVQHIAEFLGHIVSAIHTALLYAMRWIADLKWQDVVNGFKEVLRWIFVVFPRSLVKAVEAMAEHLSKLLKIIFGSLGTCVEILVACVLYMVLYIPKRIWEIISNFGSIILQSMKEVRIWFNPKAAV